MGTTVTVAFVDTAAERVVFGHVGDSRAYRLRGEELEQITTDHSLVAELVESGVLTPEEAEHHPQRSAITRAVGTERAIEADVFSLPGQQGDLFLLCSDGLTDMLSEEEIAGVLVAADRDPAAAAAALVAAANERGGEDNITVVLFELAEGEPEPKPADGVGSDPTRPSRDPDADDSGSDPAERDEGSDPAGLTPDADVRTHGAGPGGRLAALAFIVVVLAVGALALYWAVRR
jgi:protein phosphatase